MKVIKEHFLTESINTGVKVYEVEVDGPPEIGRKVIAFVDSHEEYTILTRQDKDKINKNNWDYKDDHRSPDGEYYAGSNGWIYSLGYSKYIYLDELDLIPQRHHDKVAAEKQKGEQRKQELTKSLVKIYGDELGMQLASKYISVKKDGRRVGLIGYDEYLLEPIGYTSALSSLYHSIKDDLGENIARQVIMNNPSVTSCSNHEKYGIPVGSNVTVNWDTYLSYGYSAELKNGKLILTKLINKANLSDLSDSLSRSGIVPGLKSYMMRDRYLIEKLSNKRSARTIKVIKESALNEAPRDGAVGFKLPNDMLNNPNSIDLKGMAAATKRDADRRAEEERKRKEWERNKSQYTDLIDRAIAEEDTEKSLEILFEELVPGSGPADTVAGELVRAMMRLLYRDYNDGDVFYEGYGIETCGGSVAYLIYMMDELYDEFDSIASEQLRDEEYTRALLGICDIVCDHVLFDDEVWQANEDDSRSRDLYREYEEEYREQWEPLTDYDFMIPPTVQEYIDSGCIRVGDFIDEVRSSLEDSNLRFDDVKEYTRDYILITGVDTETEVTISRWKMYDDEAWPYFIDDLRSEYGDPYEDEDDEYDDEDDDDIDESLEKPEFKKGDKVKYHGKVTTIVDIENDSEFGVDYLIVNPNYDGKDARYENIWVGDRVDPV